MGIVPKLVPLVLVALVVFTGPGQTIWRAGVDLVTGSADESAGERTEDQQLSERLRGIEPMCDTNYKPHGFEVSEGQAIALVVGKGSVDCNRVDTEPMGGGVVDRVTWAVHVDAKKPSGCEFSAEVDGQTGEVSSRFRDCG